MSKLITISELSKELGFIKSNKSKSTNHIIRYWEKEFKQIKPRFINKRRYYTPDQVRIIKFIKSLLKDNGMTINGVKKVLSNNKKLHFLFIILLPISMLKAKNQITTVFFFFSFN